MAVQDRYKSFLNDQRQFFDELITEDWETYFSDAWDETRRFEIARLFRAVKPATILDIGCGVGFHDREMAGYPFVRKVDAFDYSANSVAKANEAYGHPKVTRWVGDFAVDAPRQRYDLVVSFQVFEHLSDPSSYFRFCRDACSAGGYAAIFTPNRLRLSNRLRARQGLPFELLDPQHFKEYTVDEIHALGRAAGFRPAGSFAYGLDGLPVLAKISHGWRLRLGAMLSPMASGLCVLLQAPSDEN
jgi:2-polyprenyl-3-methyl-5-hydroxy-6-metoxy-1,4-benzoquinol methylase